MQIHGHVPSSCSAFSHSYQGTDVTYSPQAIIYVCLPNPLFLHWALLIYKITLGPLHKTKNQLMGLNTSDYAAAWNTHEQHSNKGRSSILHTLPILFPPHHHTWAPTEMFCITALCTSKNERQQQFSWTCCNLNCSEIAAVPVKAQHQDPTCPHKTDACWGLRSPF